MEQHVVAHQRGASQPVAPDPQQIALAGAVVPVEVRVHDLPEEPLRVRDACLRDAVPAEPVRVAARDEAVQRVGVQQLLLVLAEGARVAEDVRADDAAVAGDDDADGLRAPALAEGAAVIGQRRARLGGVLHGLQVAARGVHVELALIVPYAAPDLLLRGARRGGGAHAQGGHRGLRAEAGVHLIAAAIGAAGPAAVLDAEHGQFDPAARAGQQNVLAQGAVLLAADQDFAGQQQHGRLARVPRDHDGHAAGALLGQPQRAGIEGLVQRLVVGGVERAGGLEREHGQAAVGVAGHHVNAAQRLDEGVGLLRPGPRRHGRGSGGRDGRAALRLPGLLQVDGARAQGQGREPEQERQHEHCAPHGPHPLHLPKNLRISSAVILSLPSLPTTRALPSRTTVSASPRAR